MSGARASRNQQNKGAFSQFSEKVETNLGPGSFRPAAKPSNVRNQEAATEFGNKLKKKRRIQSGFKHLQFTGRSK